MCNACGFLCCASDVFEGCGCDHCECYECHSSDDDIDAAEDAMDDFLEQGGVTLAQLQDEISKLPNSTN